MSTSYLLGLGTRSFDHVNQKNMMSKHQPPLELNDDLSERAVESAVSPIKIGPL